MRPASTATASGVKLCLQGPPGNVAPAELHPASDEQLMISRQRQLDMTIQLLRRFFEVFGPMILHLVNRSIVTGIVPAAWKHAILVPLHKSGGDSSPVNYRPISILNVIFKLAEKEVRQQIVDRRYLTRNSILSPTQIAALC